MLWTDEPSPKHCDLTSGGLVHGFRRLYRRIAGVGLKSYADFRSDPHFPGTSRQSISYQGVDLKLKAARIADGEAYPFDSIYLH
jgi:hypothetical protein